ncbi:MAG: protein-L-isoaspartate O-methyltransferase [Candidatus Doudnabacteria bacterium]|nr:protein-L-isoaspartate O-methyltransferase [Candidatus Doudnabacteria bacterium]
MTKDELIAGLISSGYLKTPSIIKAFQTVDRADFVLPKYQDAAYEDHPLPIGFGQTISQPLTVALMLEWLAARPGEKILDVGCGSGWTTALLSSIVGRRGKVIGIERIPELAEFARLNLAKYHALQHNSEIAVANGSKGYKKETPYNKILASASAGEIPQAWKEQLKISGRIVAPVRDSVFVIDRISRDEYRTNEHWGFAFVPLVKD